ncbi:hypothetical protein chiPu_0029566 [Chiloscyllium punctatum]|uniref:Uncharacterized protein n=1 Tax=Chiloscyllium punctatum TaxID=137246 RepID=A0A401TSE3_CHIPU|nr:hypothetical protein [Chiloscyllium punctatum]
MACFGAAPGVAERCHLVDHDDGGTVAKNAHGFIDNANAPSDLLHDVQGDVGETLGMVGVEVVVVLDGNVELKFLCHFVQGVRDGLGETQQHEGESEDFGMTRNWEPKRWFPTGFLVRDPSAHQVLGT